MPQPQMPVERKTKSPTALPRRYKSKIIWAVDALEGEELERGPVIETLRNLQSGRQVAIEPVFVVSPDQLGIPVEMAAPWVKQYKEALQKALASKTEGVSLPHMIQPKLIVHSRPSQRGTVKALIAHAKLEGAEMIVVSSHSRQGLKRMVLGSFAETLLLLSPIPVVVVGAEARTRPNGLGSILFPTDFSESSLPVFQSAVALAKKLGSEIILHHAIPSPIEPAFQSGVYLLGGGWVPSSVFFKSHSFDQQKTAEKWLKIAQKQGVKASFELDPAAPSVVSSVLDVADKRKVGLIAMAAESGAVAAALIGSVTRKIVREASCPVWGVRAPRAKTKSKRNAH